MQRKAWVLGLALSLLIPAPLQAETTEACSPPKPGRYVVMGEGLVAQKPTAHLIVEEWLPDGRIQGIAFQRSGQDFQSQNYSGTYQAQNTCKAVVRRPLTSSIASSIAVLNPSGEPTYSLAMQPEAVFSSRWFQQGKQSCRASDLDGVVLSQQRGLSWDGRSWRPNAVVQREEWSDGTVRGQAFSSYAGQGEQATYSGQLQVRADCVARLHETDSKGATYNYSAVVLTGGRGYIYLQQEAKDLTLGLLERVSR